MLKINILDSKLFKDNQCSLQETSKDESGDKICYMTSCTKKVVNFDCVKTEFLNHLGESEERAKSVDAVVSEGDYLFFIEFKNGDMNGLRKEILLKARDSILIFNSIFNCSVDLTRQICKFVLVYNEDKNSCDSKTEISLAKAKKANVNFDRFNLADMKGFCFNDVLTFDRKQFKEEIINEYNW